jgi:hypothetical protein
MINNPVYSLTKEYISEVVSRHPPVIRKGKKRGELIGFGKEKYHCAMLVACDIPVKDISMLAGVKNNLIRKWKTEEGFQNKVDSIATQLVEYACSKLNNNIFNALKGGCNESRQERLEAEV